VIPFEGKRGEVRDQSGATATRNVCQVPDYLRDPYYLEIKCLKGKPLLVAIKDLQMLKFPLMVLDQSLYPLPGERERLKPGLEVYTKHGRRATEAGDRPGGMQLQVACPAKFSHHK